MRLRLIGLSAPLIDTAKAAAETTACSSVRAFLAEVMIANHRLVDKVRVRLRSRWIAERAIQEASRDGDQGKEDKDVVLQLLDWIVIK